VKPRYRSPILNFGGWGQLLTPVNKLIDKTLGENLDFVTLTIWQGNSAKPDFINSS